MLPIRIKLTVTIGGLLFLAMVLAGMGVVTLLRYRLTAHLEATLEQRLRGVENFLIRETRAETADRIPDELAEYASTQTEGHLIEVRDDHGNVLLKSESVKSPSISRERMFSLYGRMFHTRASASTELVSESVREVTILFLWASPALLVLIGIAGYWISRGSLKPVDEMTTAARSIGAGNLSERLSVPRSRDEIQRLAEAWNEMLSRLEESFTKMRQFTGDAAHELRSPLTILRGTAELALRRPRTDEEYRQTLGDIVRVADRLTHLTEALLSAARGENTLSPENVGNISLGSLLREGVADIQPLFADKDVKLALDTPDRETSIQGDADELRRLFAALLDNALKYTPAGGLVTVALLETDTDLTVTVTDTGCGIPADALPNVFDRFYRVDPSRDRTTGGFGLGLSIAQQIAHTHGGRIEVSSTMGQGSIFSFCLPR